MATKGSGKKSTSGKSNSKRKTSKKKNPKIKLDTNGVLILTAIISLVCIGLMFVALNQQNNVVNKGVQQVAKTIESAKNIEVKPIAVPPKNQETKKVEVAKPVESTKKVEPKVEPKVEQTKTVSKKVEPVKTAAVPNQKVAVVSNSTSNSTSVPPAVIFPQFKIPDAVGRPKLVVVLDDACHSLDKLKKYTALPMKLAIAILPGLPNSRASGQIIRAASNKEAMLHQPMQSMNLKLSPGPCSIQPDMNSFEIAELVKKNLDEVGPVKGLNNHEGSLITSNVIKIGTVLDVCMERGLFFLDSFTTAESKASQAALERDFNIVKRNVFLDDIVTREEILKQFYRGIDIANKNGSVIMIGHIDKSSEIIPELLSEMYPILVQKGYVFAFPSELL